MKHTDDEDETDQNKTHTDSDSANKYESSGSKETPNNRVAEANDSNSTEDVDSDVEQINTSDGSFTSKGVTKSSIELDAEMLERELDGAVLSEVLNIYEQARAIEKERDKLDEQVESLEEQLEQERADFKSYKKQRKERMEKERNQYIQELFTGIIDIHSNIYRGLETEHDSIESIQNGFETVLTELEEELKQNGVKIVLPDVEKEVDTQDHDIVAKISSDDVASGQIISVESPGYIFKNELIKPASVVVSK